LALGRAKRLTLRDFEDATASLTNLGMCNLQILLGCPFPGCTPRKGENSFCRTLSLEPAGA
jgi:hypothetical protein